MEWINVNDRLPEIGVNVKVKIGCVSIGRVSYSESIGHVINEHGRFNVDLDRCKVKFWMPEPPNINEQN